MMADDLRLEWIKVQACKYLGIKENPEAFAEMLEANDSECDDKIARFLNTQIEDDDDQCKMFFAYRTFYEKLVEEEIEVQVLVEKPPPPEPEPPPPPKAKGKGGKGKGGKEKKGRSGKKSKTPTESEAREPASVAETTEDVTEIETEGAELEMDAASAAAAADAEAEGTGSPMQTARDVLDEDAFAGDAEESPPPAELPDNEQQGEIKDAPEQEATVPAEAEGELEIGTSGAEEGMADEEEAAAEVGAEAAERALHERDDDGFTASEPLDPETGEMERERGGADPVTPSEPVTEGEITETETLKAETPSKEGKAIKDKGKHKKGKKKKKKEEPEPEPEPEEYVTVTKIIETVVLTPRLHGIFGSLDPNKIEPDRRYMYILRRYNEPVRSFDTWDETNARMINYFYVGSCTGKLLRSYGAVMTKAYKPLVSAQFREPVASDMHGEKQKSGAAAGGGSGGENGEDGGVGDAVKAPSGQSLLAAMQPMRMSSSSKPSEFRRNSLGLMKKSSHGLLSKTKVNSSRNFRHTADPTPMKNELINSIEEMIDVVFWYGFYSNLR